MLSRLDQPVVAIATAPGRAAVGIVRVSGAALGVVVEAICGRALTPREATYLPFRDAIGAPIDRGLAIFFPAPHSYTGEEVLELQAHGGPVVLDLLLARCLEAGAAIGLRVAEPGEFTRRAFLNGKMDLAQAEAVADLIDASTEAAARSAVRSIEGAFSREVHAVANALLHLRMLVEATLDFPEEEIDFLERDDARGQLERIRASLSGLIETSRQGALLREGIKVVIAGQPNAGKSSLLNALAGFERAIVTPVAGTTRDVLTASIQIEGVPLHVVDTAGLRAGGDEVERIGIDRAWNEIERADALLFLHDISRRDDPAHQAADAEIDHRLRRAEIPVIDVWNKLDLAPAVADRRLPAGAIALSARTGEGLPRLRARLLELVGFTAAPEGLHLARSRHVHALGRAAKHLALSTECLDQRPPALELFAEELRLAHVALGEITGRVSADDLLGEIFASFCIGK